jgi:nucleoside-diphosphate-sugar epimerase
MLTSFRAMHGLDYVALRYFNVYGPRMDIHGLYTEVLIRWMQRIAAGQPPLIFGDGPADDGLRLHRPTSRARTSWRSAAV